jgi:hypothetical protein
VVAAASERPLVSNGHESRLTALELDQVREVPLVHVANDLAIAAAHAGSPFILCRRQFAFPHLLVIVLGLDLLLLWTADRWTRPRCGTRIKLKHP